MIRMLSTPTSLNVNTDSPTKCFSKFPALLRALDETSSHAPSLVDSKTG